MDQNGHLKVSRAETLKDTTPQERGLFCLLNGMYSLPTQELVNFLHSRIDGRVAIEIGAGTGTLAAALSIPATDNRQQEDGEIKAFYDLIRQTTVPYGDHVEKLDAASAVAKYRPQVVIACWVTHLYDPAHPCAEGSETGVNEAAIIASCDEYIFIGNEKVHQHKPIWALPHEKLTPSWIYSRAMNGSKDFIGIWRRSKDEVQGNGEKFGLVT